MSREIKFRALKDDMSDCRFYYGSLIYDKQGNPRIQDTDIDLFHTCIKGTESQYTGLKDKNGKEIYEGDVIEGYKGGSNHDLYYKGIVEWNKQQCGFVFREGKYIGEFLSLAMEGFENEIMLSKFEVIGNIYENPELINQ